MKTPGVRQEEGQTLIQVALMLVVLIGFVGLAIDGGNLYAQRRMMQNAADAGALAGAWAMCRVNDVTAAKNVAADYMRKNGDADAAAGNVDIADYKVTAHASKPVSPFLPFTFGNAVNVPADASAACGAANSACGVFPLAYSESAWNELVTAGACTTGYKIAIWNDDNQTLGSFSCKISNQIKQGFCNCYKCEDSTGQPIYITDSDGRAWVDFSPIPDLVTGSTTPGCGTNELRDHINGVASIKLSVGTCVSTTTGNHNGVKNEIIAQIGKDKSIVIFDEQPCTTTNCPGGTPRHVSSLGCIKILSPGWEQYTFQAKPGAKKLQGNGNLPDEKMFVVWAKMNCNGECDSACGSTDGTTPPDPSGVNAANLVQ